ncbi:kinase-like domain-containing protein [Halteromyces radiatus]|uniref:kinase-like domain-containing protein n=1 Tax=Halteromyces radiatus TaxID=101107 RepID=UPI00221E7354|nr:kinase-like domain-containing protein [Halteromyces radiatus]KAI8089615.1 kinase-like domain-containing protein [Halteromyces radiatus]
MSTTISSDYWSELSQSLIDTTVGDYQFVEDLGHGSYGGLFLGQSLKTKSYVAIKVLNKSGLTVEQQQLQQLEIDIQSQLKHPSLLALHSVMQDHSYIYMVMDLCDQGDLFDYVIRDQQDRTSRPEHVAKDLFIQILEGIEQMHAQGIYHRDIKLENILLKGLDDDTDGFDCKVADFGLATRDRWSMEFGCGSATYLAPEHFSNDDEYDDDQDLKPYDSAASDVWSLGILLLALMFGRNPWQEANLADPAFAEYKRNPTMLKQHLFPTLSSETALFLQQSVLTLDPSRRVSVSEMLKQFRGLTLYQEEDDDEEVSPLTPVDIPQQQQQEGKDGQPRYDSAFFSMSAAPGAQGLSWSDMVEEDISMNDCLERTPSSSSSYYQQDDDDDTDMFVHSDEKESWWL